MKMSWFLLYFLNILPDIKFLVHRLFFFQHFEYVIHCLLILMVFVEKSAVILIEDPLYELLLLLLSGFCLSSLITWLCLVDLFEFFHLAIIELLGCVDLCLQIWKVFRHYFFKYYLCPFPPLLELPLHLSSCTYSCPRGFLSPIYFSSFFLLSLKLGILNRYIFMIH